MLQSLGSFAGNGLPDTDCPTTVGPAVTFFFGFQSGSKNTRLQ
jgi:hypothetical protein